MLPKRVKKKLKPELIAFRATKEVRKWLESNASKDGYKSLSEYIHSLIVAIMEKEEEIQRALGGNKTRNTVRKKGRS